MKIKKIILIKIFLLPLILLGQQESYYSFYSYNMSLINPAYAGADSEFMFSLTSRKQWSSIDNAPNTTAFSFSSARKNNVGLGISVISDKVFIEQQTYAYVDFSYKLEVGNNSKLFLGLKGGGNFYRADPSLLKSYSTQADPTKIILSEFNPNIGAGAYLKTPNYWISLSIPRLLNSKRDSNFVVTAKDIVHSYLAAGAYIKINDKLKLKPSLMLRSIKGLPLTTDITGMISWQDSFDFGVSFRSNSSMSLLSMASFGIFDIGFAFETPTENGLSSLNLKTFELVFRIKLGEGKQSVIEIQPDSSEEAK